MERIDAVSFNIVVQAGKERRGWNTPNIFVNELNLGPKKGPLPCATSGLSVLPLPGEHPRLPWGGSSLHHRASLVFSNQGGSPGRPCVASGMGINPGKLVHI